MGAMHARNMQSDFAVNKYLQTVASCWILLIYELCLCVLYYSLPLIYISSLIFHLIYIAVTTGLFASFKCDSRSVCAEPFLLLVATPSRMHVCSSGTWHISNSLPLALCWQRLTFPLCCDTQFSFLLTLPAVTRALTRYTGFTFCLLYSVSNFEVRHPIVLLRNYYVNKH